MMKSGKSLWGTLDGEEDEDGDEDEDGAEDGDRDEHDGVAKTERQPSLKCSLASDMEGLTTCCINRFLLPCRRTPTPTPTPTPAPTNNSRKLNFLVFASKDDGPKLDHWDQMELKFGRMIGEDPKLTLAKVMGRKSNPDVSYLEIEKSFRNKKGALDNEIVDLPFDDGTGKSNSLNGLNLVRPVPKKGVKFQVDSKSDKKLNPSPSLGFKVVDSSTKSRSTPNVMLRKPSSFQEDDIDIEKHSRMKIRPNLVLKMSKDKAKDNYSDIKLLKKPEAVLSIDDDPDQEKVNSGNSVGSSSGRLDMSGEAKTSQQNSLSSMAKIDYNSILQKPSHDSFSKVSELEDESKIGLQPLEKSDLEVCSNDAAVNQPLDTNSLNSTSEFSEEAALRGKPQRLNQSIQQSSIPVSEETICVSDSIYNENAEIGTFIAAAALQGREDADWTRAEELLKTEEREEVELISCSTRGFVASFGSLIGFLPYRNLGAKWKFLAFESWLRRKGLDPSIYKQNLSIIGGYEVQNNLDASPNPALDGRFKGELSQDMRLEDLLEIYDQEKIKFLQSFVGQRIKVNVVLADRNSRRLMFSRRPKEKEELVEKKRNLMAKLSIGDVVKCCIKKITYFGIFVEVEGVPALIHQSEVSWDATLDPSFFKIGQIVEAKVHQLDFALERISLSLKEITPDPLIEALEFVVGDRNSLDGKLEAAQADEEWTEVESLIKELQQIKGVQSVSKGRFFLSPGLAPTFQVYMASMFENQYKLLARSGNKVQEVIVQASLDKEQMKAVILTWRDNIVHMDGASHCNVRSGVNSFGLGTCSAATSPVPARSLGLAQ
ncbi:Ribosomal protein S1 [Macleaya cordata]|uniref:Ribosomal protein S1 n=1 Tax=Macleaya cordata TaxID=56857 RepID=A0A200QGA8_MACCD|nr:Ribosomal protein S1 [Macleaya cordata]